MKINLNIKARKRFKNWYSKKPKQDIWFYGFWIVLIAHYLIKPIVWISFLQIGLLSPELEVGALNETFYNVSKTTTEALITPMKMMVEVGQNIAIENPTTAKIISNFLGFMVTWGLYIIIIYLVQGILRGFVVDIYKRFRKKNRK